MPGPHLELKLMQCYADVGGADGWLSGHWDQGSQWWTGWHLPGPAGPAGLRAWSWPNDQWVLIGFERWDSFRKFPHTRLREAYYQFPNPSTLAAWQAPVGHYHIRYHRNGRQEFSRWDPNPLDDPHHLYLKGGDNGKGKGKGKVLGEKGKGEKGEGKNGKGE